MSNHGPPFYGDSRNKDYYRGDEYRRREKPYWNDQGQYRSRNNHNVSNNRGYSGYNPRGNYQNRNMRGQDRSFKRRVKTNFISKVKQNIEHVPQNKVVKDAEKLGDKTPQKRKLENSNSDPKAPKKQRELIEKDITDDEEVRDKECGKTKTNKNNVVKGKETTKGNNIKCVKTDSNTDLNNKKIKDKGKDEKVSQEETACDPKTIEFIGILDKKNKKLEQEKQELEHLLKEKEEALLKMSDDKEVTSNDTDAAAKVKELQTTLKRVRTERTKHFNSGEELKKVLKSKKAVIAGHVVSRELLMKEIETKEKQILSVQEVLLEKEKIIEGLKEENTILKRAFVIAKEFKDSVEKVATARTSDDNKSSSSEESVDEDKSNEVGNEGDEETDGESMSLLRDGKGRGHSNHRGVRKQSNNKEWNSEDGSEEDDVGDVKTVVSGEGDGDDGDVKTDCEEETGSGLGERTKSNNEEEIKSAYDSDEDEGAGDVKTAVLTVEENDDGDVKTGHEGGTKSSSETGVKSDVEEGDKSEEGNVESDEERSQSEYDINNKTFTVNTNGKDQDSIDYFIPSDEEFPDNKFEVGRTIVSNYLNSKETIIDYSKIPDDIFEEGSRFQANPTSLNNKIVFIACNNNVGEHKPDKEDRKKFCELAPVCHIAWNKGDKITKVLIIDSENHPKNNKTVWACRHHAQASIDGVILQTQRYKFLRAGKREEKAVDTKETDVKEVGVKENDKKDGRIKRKKVKVVVEKEDMYDRIKNGKQKK